MCKEGPREDDLLTACARGTGKRLYHEEAIGRLYESLKLVLSLLQICGRVKQVDVV